MVAHPALSSPATPSAVSAERMTAPQNGATSSLQSATRMSGGGEEERRLQGVPSQLRPAQPAACRALTLQPPLAHDALVIGGRAPGRQVVGLADAVQQRLLVGREALLPWLRARQALGGGGGGLRVRG